MADYDLFHQHLRDHKWSKAYEWLEPKVRVYQNKAARRLTVAHVYGILLAIMTAFFTWVVLYPSADKKELKAFPLTTLCHDLFHKLCEIVPYGKPAVIGAAIASPFVVGGVLALLSLAFRPKRYTDKDKKARKTPEMLKNRLELLEKLIDKCNNGYIGVFFLYFVLAVVLTGITMMISAVPGGLNPFEYLIVGAVCAAVQAGVFLAYAWVFSWFCTSNETWNSLARYNCKSTLDRFLEKDTPKREIFISDSSLRNTEYYKEKFNEYYAQYTGTEYETPEQKAARLVREVEDDLSGSGKWDY